MEQELIFDKEDQTDKRDKDSRSLEHVRKFMRQSQLYRRPHLEISTWSRELYECWRVESKSITQRANIKLPYGYTIIETQLPQIVEGLLHDRPFIQLQGEAPADMQFEQALTDYQDKQVNAMKFPIKILSYVKAMKLDGTAFAKVPYKYKEQMVTRRETVADPLTGMPLLQKHNVLEATFDGPDFEVIPFIDFYPDWSVKLPGDIESMRGLVHRTWKTFSDLKKLEKRTSKTGQTTGHYKNLAELKTSMRVKGCSDGAAWKAPYFSDSYGGHLDNLNDNMRGIKDGDKIEVWEYWGLFDTSGDGTFEEYIITIGNGDVVLRCEKNFYDYKIKPFVSTPNIIRDSEFYGIPELAAVKGLIKESSTIRNSILDQINLSINQMFIVDRNSGINAKSLFSRPGGIIWANDINGIRQLQPTEVPGGAYRSNADIQTDLQSAVGLSQAPGNPSTFNTALARSATGANYLQQFTGGRVGMSLRILGETLLKPMSKIMFLTNRQFVTDDKYLRTGDPNKPNPFTIVPMEAWQFSFHWKLCTTLETGGPQTDGQKMQMLIQMLQTQEATQPGITKWDAVWEQLGRDIVGPRYVKFVRSDEERMAMQQQMMMNEAAANASVGARQSGAAMQGAAAPQPNAIGGMGNGV